MRHCGSGLRRPGQLPIVGFSIEMLLRPRSVLTMVALRQAMRLSWRVGDTVRISPRILRKQPVGPRTRPLHRVVVIEKRIAVSVERYPFAQRAESIRQSEPVAGGEHHRICMQHLDPAVELVPDDEPVGIAVPLHLNHIAIGRQRGIERARFQITQRIEAAVDRVNRRNRQAVAGQDRVLQSGLLLLAAELQIGLDVFR